MCIFCNNQDSFNLSQLTEIDISDCKYIKNIPNIIFSQLVKFDCSFTNINQISNIFMPNLEILECSNSKIKQIPYFPKLKILVAGKTLITEIDCRLITLEKLYIQDTYIKHIPNTLTKLILLNIDNTDIKFIPTNLINIKYLFHNKL